MYGGLAWAAQLWRSGNSAPLYLIMTPGRFAGLLPFPLSSAPSGAPVTAGSVSGVGVLRPRTERTDHQVGSAFPPQGWSVGRCETPTSLASRHPGRMRQSPSAVVARSTPNTQRQHVHLTVNCHPLAHLISTYSSCLPRYSPLRADQRSHSTLLDPTTEPHRIDDRRV